MVWLYFIPLAVMSALYAIIGNQVWHKLLIKYLNMQTFFSFCPLEQLWRSAPVGVPTDIQRENVKSKKRVRERALTIIPP